MSHFMMKALRTVLRTALVAGGKFPCKLLDSLAEMLHLIFKQQGYHLLLYASSLPKLCLLFYLGPHF